MPGMLQGMTTSALYYPRIEDRWLNFRFGHPPNKNINLSNDSIGQRNPYKDWISGERTGDEETGMAPFRAVVFDADIRFSGTKAFSYKIEGQCFDQAGNPAPGVTVELWWIDVNYVDAHQPLLMGTTVADAQGKYGFAVDNTTRKYEVKAYDGSRGGVTVRNLVGA
jgi:hypothetical protein